MPMRIPVIPGLPHIGGMTVYIQETEIYYPFLNDAPNPNAR
jgi:hypothetical protein